MRTKGFAMILIGTACLIGCGKKDPGDAFIGTWKCESMTVGSPGLEKTSSCEKEHITITCEIRKAERGENRYDITIKAKEIDPKPTHATGIYDRDTGTLNAGGGIVVLDINKDGTLSYHNDATFYGPAADMTLRKVR